VTQPETPSQPTKPPSRRLIWLLTVATGASVANLYYNQPLLSDIARTFHATSRAAGIIATLTQAGYAVGMLLFVPLGDVVERRRLIVILLCCVTGALLLAASGPTLGVVAAASFAIGVTTVVPLGFIFFPLKLPAWGVLGSWFLLQWLYSSGTAVSSGAGVAYLAHVFGFIAGAAIALATKPFLDGTREVSVP